MAKTMKRAVVIDVGDADTRDCAAASALLAAAAKALAKEADGETLEPGGHGPFTVRVEVCGEVIVNEPAEAQTCRYDATDAGACFAYLLHHKGLDIPALVRDAVETLKNMNKAERADHDRHVRNLKQSVKDECERQGLVDVKTRTPAVRCEPSVTVLGVRTA